MRNPIGPSDTTIPFNEDPEFIVSDLDPRQLVKIILNLYHNSELTLGFDEDTYKLMDDLHATGHGGEPRYEGSHMLRKIFGGLNSGLDKKLP